MHVEYTQLPTFLNASTYVHFAPWQPYNLNLAKNTGKEKQNQLKNTQRMETYPTEQVLTGALAKNETNFRIRHLLDQNKQTKASHPVNSFQTIVSPFLLHYHRPFLSHTFRRELNCNGGALPFPLSFPFPFSFLPALPLPPLCRHLSMLDRKCSFHGDIARGTKRSQQNNTVFLRA